MDEDFNARLSVRARRAMPLIAAVLTVIVVVSLVYLHPGFGAARRPLSLPVPSPSPPLISNRFAVTYDFATPTTGWSLVVEQIQASASYLVFATTDGAHHWRRQLGGQCGSNDAFPFSAMRYGTLFKTSDSGQTWKQAAQIMDEWDYLPGVIDARHAWARLRALPAPGNAPQGTGLAITADGGLHWTCVNVPQPS